MAKTQESEPARASFLSQCLNQTMTAPAQNDPGYNKGISLDHGVLGAQLLIIRPVQEEKTQILWLQKRSM